MPVENLAPSTQSPPTHYRQTISPVYLRGSHVKDDTDNHDYVTDARGKGRPTFAVSSTSTGNQAVTIYGMHQSTGTVGAAGTFQVGGSNTVTSTSAFFVSSTGVFPFYLCRVQGGDTTDTSAPTIRVYVNMSGFP